MVYRENEKALVFCSVFSRSVTLFVDILINKGIYLYVIYVYIYIHKYACTYGYKHVYTHKHIALDAGVNKPGARTEFAFECI